MPEFVEEETGRRLYHENETTLEIEKAIAKKFIPKKMNFDERKNNTLK